MSQEKMMRQRQEKRDDRDAELEGYKNGKRQRKSQTSRSGPKPCWNCGKKKREKVKKW